VRISVWATCGFWSRLRIDVLQSVDAASCLVAADVDVETECCEGRDTTDAVSQGGISHGTGASVQAEQREGEQSLVDPAHHNSSVLVPMRLVAHVRQCSAHVVREHTPAQRPEQRKHAVDREVQAWVEADAAVHDNREEQGCDGEEGGCSELWGHCQLWLSSHTLAAARYP
jgi:hypothetical protein